MNAAAIKKTLYRTIFIIAAVYCAIAVFMTFYQRNIMYYPGGVISPDLSEAAGAAAFPVQTEDGLELSGLYWKAKDPEASIIVYFHGNASNPNFWLERGQAYSQEGYGFLLAEYRGYGGNPGSITEKGLYSDGRAYIKALQDQGIALDKIVLMGYSLGTGIAVQMAQEYQDISALILLAPYSSFVDIGRMQYWMFPLDYLMWDQYRSIDKIKHIKKPLLVIHGERDKTIPISFAQKLFEQANQPKTFIRKPQAGHNNLFMHGAHEYTVGFLQELKYPHDRSSGLK